MSPAIRTFVHHLVCSSTVLILIMSIGCKNSTKNSTQLHSSSTSILHSNGHLEVQKVQDILAQNLETIDDQPSDRDALLKSSRGFVAVLSQIDTAACPADFRKQFEVSRQAWMANAADLQKEYVHYQLHPEEDPEKGGHPGPEADRLAREKLLSLQAALFQNGELRSLSAVYGVTWK